MKDFREYNVFYDASNVRLGYLKFEETYSIVKSNQDGYVEVLVEKEKLEEALEAPGLCELTFTGKMELLFGNMSGLENFLSFCDQENIYTRTFHWE